jgi:hypothetical protein
VVVENISREGTRLVVSRQPLLHRGLLRRQWHQRSSRVTACRTLDGVANKFLLLSHVPPHLEMTGTKGALGASNKAKGPPERPYGWTGGTTYRPLKLHGRRGLTVVDPATPLFARAIRRNEANQIPLIASLALGLGGEIEKAFQIFVIDGKCRPGKTTVRALGSIAFWLTTGSVATLPARNPPRARPFAFSWSLVLSSTSSSPIS